MPRERDALAESRFLTHLDSRDGEAVATSGVSPECKTQGAVGVQSDPIELSALINPQTIGETHVK